MSEAIPIYDESALIQRLTKGASRDEREIVFLVGAPLTAPLVDDTPGVLGVPQLIELVRDEFVDDPDHWHCSIQSWRLRTIDIKLHSVFFLGDAAKKI